MCCLATDGETCVPKRCAQDEECCGSRSPSRALSPFLGEGSPTKIDYPYSNPSTGGPGVGLNATWKSARDTHTQTCFSGHVFKRRRRQATGRPLRGLRCSRVLQRNHNLLHHPTGAAQPVYAVVQAAFHGFPFAEMNMFIFPYWFTTTVQTNISRGPKPMEVARRVNTPCMRCGP